MTAPRPVFPGHFLAIQRRCTQRQFLMGPDDETNNAFTMAIAKRRSTPVGFLPPDDLLDL